MRTTHVLFALAVAAVVAAGGTFGPDFAAPFVLDRSGEKMFTDIFSSRPDMVVDKTRPDPRQEMVWLYNPVTREWLERVPRWQVNAAAKRYPNVAIVSPKQHNVYEFPPADVTVVVNGPQTALASRESADKP